MGVGGGAGLGKGWLVWWGWGAVGRCGVMDPPRKPTLNKKTTEHLAGPPPRIRDVKESA